MPSRSDRRSEQGQGEPEGLADFQVNRPVSMRRRVYDSLRDRILGGGIPTGARLVEARLAEQIGASRTPVREALHLLEREGLVESVPRGGYQVRGVAWSEVEEICEIRALNETLAARWAIERLTPADLAALEENLARSQDELDAGRFERFAERDGEFHEILARASGSRRLVELCETLRRHMLLYRVESLGVPETARTALAGHRRIVEKVRERDPEGVAQAIRLHLREAKEGIRRCAPENGGRQP